LPGLGPVAWRRSGATGGAWLAARVVRGWRRWWRVAGGATGGAGGAGGRRTRIYNFWPYSCKYVYAPYTKMQKTG